MNELYWISVVGNINDALGVILFLAAIVLIIVVIISLMTRSYRDMEDEEWRQRKKRIKKAAIVWVFLVLIMCFIPSKKQMYVIYGVGGTIDYVKQDSIGKQLPHKAIVALDKYMENLNEE